MNSSSQLGLDLVHDAAEGSLVVHCEVGQHLAVDLDGSLLQAVGELAVCQAQFTCSGVDTGNPQLAEHALLVAAVTVGVLPSLHYRLFGDTEDITAATTETLGKGGNFLVTGTGRYTPFDARHVCTPSWSVDYRPALCSICAMEPMLVSCTFTAPRRWRLFLVVFFVKM